MATGWPMKTTYANGDVYSASDVNDTNGTINLLGASVAYTAGKNRIINGDYRFNQRAFTSNTANNSFSFDRWLQLNAGTTGTLTVTPQTFSPGTAPVTGYEGINYLQAVTAAGASADTYAMVNQKIEDVRTFANQAITVSFWAKAASGTPKISVEMEQNFGSGGSGGVLASSSAAATISTSWARYSFNVTVPSISGKTIGTSSYIALNIWLSAGSSFATRANSIGLQNATFQIWGVQAENGSTATAFQTATGTIQGELAACQRYFEALVDGTGGVDGTLSIGFNYTTVLAVSTINYTSKRVNPSISLFSGNLEAQLTGGAIAALSAVGFAGPTATACQIYGSCSGITTGQGNQFRSGTVAYVIHVSAEL
jgi:hypothetical protein